MLTIKATKKPVTIEAMQINCGDDVKSALNWMDESEASASGDSKKCELYIDTLEGVMTASRGDYIIKGVQGEFYPCKPDIFKATYNYRCKCGEDISFESVGCIYCKN